jgi:hypothetical protein
MIGWKGVQEAGGKGGMPRDSDRKRDGGERRGDRDMGARGRYTDLAVDVVESRYRCRYV